MQRLHVLIEQMYFQVVVQRWLLPTLESWLQVDCAFYSEDMQQVGFNPVGDIKKALESAQEKDVEDKCPECFDNQLQWFCSSVVPKCGSVRASLESAILPAISKVPFSCFACRDGASVYSATIAFSDCFSKPAPPAVRKEENACFGMESKRMDNLEAWTMF